MSKFEDQQVVLARESKKSSSVYYVATILQKHCTEGDVYEVEWRGFGKKSKVSKTDILPLTAENVRERWGYDLSNQRKYIADMLGVTIHDLPDPVDFYGKRKKDSSRDSRPPKKKRKLQEDVRSLRIFDITKKVLDACECGIKYHVTTNKDSLKKIFSKYDLSETGQDFVLTFNKLRLPQGRSDERLLKDTLKDGILIFYEADHHRVESWPSEVIVNILTPYQILIQSQPRRLISDSIYKKLCKTIDATVINGDLSKAEELVRRCMKGSKAKVCASVIGMLRVIHGWIKAERRNEVIVKLEFPPSFQESPPPSPNARESSPGIDSRWRILKVGDIVTSDVIYRGKRAIIVKIDGEYCDVDFFNEGGRKMRFQNANLAEFSMVDEREIKEAEREKMSELNSELDTLDNLLKFHYEKKAEYKEKASAYKKKYIEYKKKFKENKKALDDNKGSIAELEDKKRKKRSDIALAKDRSFLSWVQRIRSELRS